MTLDFATVIIEKAFELTYKELESQNSESNLVDDLSQLDIEKVKKLFDLGDIKEIGFLDCCEGEQQDDRAFAESILEEVSNNENLISLKVFFESDSPNQQYYRFLIQESC